MIAVEISTGITDNGNINNWQIVEEERRSLSHFCFVLGGMLEEKDMVLSEGLELRKSLNLEK